MIKRTFIVIMILLLAMGYASGQTTHRIIMNEVKRHETIRGVNMLYQIVSGAFCNVVLGIRERVMS